MTQAFKIKSDTASESAANTLAALNATSGYIPSFINPGSKVLVSDDLLTAEQKKQLPHVNKKQGKLTYTNLSVYYNTHRRVPFYSAYNIDLSLKSQGKRASKFKPDPRFNEDQQLSYKKFYDLVKGSDKDFDIGHMAGSDEMAWDKNGQVKSLQTFFFPNTCPQAASLNQKLWNQLERKLVTAQNNKEEGKICVFTGPVIDKDDPYYKHESTFQLPMRFYKVIVFEYKGKMYATALVMSHVNIVKELGLMTEKKETLRLNRTRLIESPIDDFPHRGIYQVNVELVSKLTGINFSWAGVSPVEVPVKYNTLKNIDENETPGDLAEKGVRRNAHESFGTNVSETTATNPYGFVLV